MTHECKKGKKGWCTECDCTLICKKCGHRGLDTVGRCFDDSFPADKVWCPECDSWFYVQIATGRILPQEEPQKWMEDCMKPWGKGVVGEDGIIVRKKPSKKKSKRKS